MAQASNWGAGNVSGWLLCVRRVGVRWEGERGQKVARDRRHLLCGIPALEALAREMTFGEPFPGLIQ